MLDDFIGTYGNNLIVAVVGVGVALLALAIILWLVRRRGGSSPFIRGGKNRQPRLQVLDATAVDARRRLVLVRRDNVEHLVMIGGPTDIVIESGIGAIPILRDVRDPQDEILQSLAAEKALSSSRRSLAQPQEDEARSSVQIAVATEAPSAVAMTEVKPAPVATPRPAPEPAQRPVPPAASAPSAPVTPAPKQQAAPAQAPTQPAAAAPVPPSATPPAPTPLRQTAPQPMPPTEGVTIPKAIAREPVVAPIAPSPIPAVTAASLQAELAAKPAVATAAPSAPVQKPVIATPAQPITLDPASKQEPVIDPDSAIDFLDAARDRVLPTFRNENTMNATANVAKPEPLAPNKDGAVFGDQLTSDFESFLQAEIEKSNATGTPTVSLEPARQQKIPEPVRPVTTSETTDHDVQKEMARIFGEMAVTRDR